jgi:hypothetical protein
MEKIVETLVHKAGETNVPHEALQFSQAACNVTHVMRQLAEIRAVTSTAQQG